MSASPIRIKSDLSCVIGPLKEWNRLCACPDNSVISSLNEKVKVIKISGGSKTSKRAELQIGHIDPDCRTRSIERFAYHPRVEAFRVHGYKDHDNHSFPEMVDFVLQKLGEINRLEDPISLDCFRISLRLHGRLIHPIEDSKISGTFELSFVCTDQGNFVIHRLFRPSSFNYKTLHVSDRQSVRLEYWQMKILKMMGKVSDLDLRCFIFSGVLNFRWFKRDDIPSVEFFLTDCNSLYLVGTDIQITHVIHLLELDGITLQESAVTFFDSSL